MSTTITPNWYDKFPTPQSTPGKITAEELHSKLISVKTNDEGVPLGKDFLVVDVRRTDLDVGLIPGAVNFPAHSFYQTLPAMIPILSEYKQVIFHCQSSSGRGPRCAAWYEDKLKELKIEENQSKSLILVGGIKNWVKLYKGTKMLIELEDIA